MSWIDLVLVLVFASLTALGAERRLSGLTVGLGGAIAFRPILALAGASPYAALGMALAVGLLLGFAARRVTVRTRAYLPLTSVLGALGGGAMGLLTVLALTTALPLGRDLEGRIVYPPRDVAPAITSALQGSRLIEVGFDILLYPLLEPQEGQYGQAEKVVYGALHGLFVHGAPWERR